MASLPMTIIYGPKGKLRVNTCDLAIWKAKGYSTAPQPEPKQEAKTDPNPDPEGTNEPAKPAKGSETKTK